MIIIRRYTSIFTLQELKEREAYLKGIIAKKKKNLDLKEPRRIRVVKHNNGYQYYLRSSPSDINGIYIPISKQNKIKPLAQQKYDKEIINAAKCELEFIYYIYQHLPTKPEEIYNTFSPGLKPFVTPISISDELYISNWLSLIYEQNEFHNESLEFCSNSGVQMRSKSEVIISTILDKLEIPYLYEKQLILADGTCVYPDFTLLDIRTRSEIYYEHLGMMDDPEYISHNLQKINRYENSGYYLGDSLIISTETLEHPLDIRLVEQKLRNRFAL